MGSTKDMITGVMNTDMVGTEADTEAMEGATEADTVIDDWYEVHNCLGCGQRIVIAERADGKLESKGNYNRKLYHNRTCEGLLRKDSPIRHGTSTGYTRCVEREEGSCKECRDAIMATQHKQPARVKRKAIARLAEIYAEELQSLIQDMS